MIWKQIKSWINNKFHKIYKPKKFKKFFVRKILREVYSIDDMESMEWSEMNDAEKNMITENLYMRVSELESSHEAIIHYMSTVPTRCDKCSNYEGREVNCFKCENSGVVQKDQLIGWPW